MLVKLMSYNTQHCMNYITRKIDFNIIADTIRKCGADIVGLQEIRNESKHRDYQDQAAILAEKLGFYHYFAEAKKFKGVNPYGNAILSRYPIKKAETIPIPNPKIKLRLGYYETRCLLNAEIDVGGGLRVLVSHFGLNKDEQKNAVETVVRNIKNKACVLMGDFNVKPNDKILAPIKSLMSDAADRFTEEKFSFPSDRPNRKLDYIFTSLDLAIIDADIPPIISSDHRPHLATIEL